MLYDSQSLHIALAANEMTGTMTYDEQGGRRRHSSWHYTADNRQSDSSGGNIFIFY